MGGGSEDDQDLVGVGPGWVALPTLHILRGGRHGSVRCGA